METEYDTRQKSCQVRDILGAWAFCVILVGLAIVGSAVGADIFGWLDSAMISAGNAATISSGPVQ